MHLSLSGCFLNFIYITSQSPPSLLCHPQIQQLEDRLRTAESTAAAAAAASSASGPSHTAAAAAAAEERVVAMQQQLAAAKTQVCGQGETVGPGFVAVGTQYSGKLQRLCHGSSQGQFFLGGDRVGFH